MFSHTLLQIFLIKRLLKQNKTKELQIFSKVIDNRFSYSVDESQMITSETTAK